VDISDTLTTKLSAVRCYGSQFPPEKEYIYERIEAWARRLGPTAGYTAGELLVSPRSLGTQDLMTAVFGDK
jgi:LmbE family N-acetylglucosaminyl deacetylase